MQGRLSPPLDGRIQSFPAATWAAEFARAREAGLDCIEWIHDIGTIAVDPLRTDSGIAEVRRLADRTGVGVWSICADYYMAEPLLTAEGLPDDRGVRHLEWLLGRAARLGARYVVLPFVDSSSLKTPRQIHGLLAVLRTVIRSAEVAGVELHLETDLPPSPLRGVLEAMPHPLVLANYDTGNSAALGYDPAEELASLGSRLGSVHVKDRARGGATVPLGSGAADFLTCFRLFGEVGFQGPFILQVAREEGVSEVELAVRNRRFVEEQLAAVGLH